MSLDPVNSEMENHPEYDAVEMDKIIETKE